MVATLITSLGVIIAFVCKHLNKLVNKITEPILKEIKQMDKNQCMNYLTEFLADVRNGVVKSDYQRFRATEVYEHYTKELQGNSYIHEQWEKYMK